VTWLEFWDTVSVLQIVGWILGFLGIAAFLVKGWPTFKKLVAFLDALFSLPAFIARTDHTLRQQDVKIDAIHHEVNFNTGTSVKDAVIRAENAIERVELGVKGLYTRADASDLADRELREDLENTRPAVAKRRTAKPKEIL
jgi:hypothetical protein